VSTAKVTVVLSSQAWTRYSIEAQARRVALATYLRQRLEEQDRLIGELTIRAVCEASAAAADGKRTAAPESDSGTLVEMLLLLRSLSGPQRSAIAQAEVERRGG
jgi:hypothetical protein